MSDICAAEPDLGLDRVASWSASIPWERIFRHVCTYLIWTQQSYSMLLKHFDRLREVRVGVGTGIGISRQLYPLCRSTHAVKCGSS
jgi:hypothetical protein